MQKPTMAHLVGSLLVFFLVSGSVMAQWYIPECEDVDDIIYCGGFLVGLTDDPPPPECSNAIKQIDVIAKRESPQRVCMCVQNTVKGFWLPVLAARAESLPIKCHTNLSYPISTSVDCGYEGD